MVEKSVSDWQEAVRLLNDTTDFLAAQLEAQGLVIGLLRKQLSQAGHFDSNKFDKFLELAAKQPMLADKKFGEHSVADAILQMTLSERGSAEILDFPGKPPESK